MSLPPYTLADYRKSIGHMHQQAQFGCGNGGRLIHPPQGQHTNAGCKCSPREIARTLRQIADAVEWAGPMWGKP